MSVTGANSRWNTGLIWKTLVTLDLTFKQSVHAAQQDRPDVAKARTEWRRKRPELNPVKLVFIDATWTKTNMTRLRDRARGPMRNDTGQAT